ncbi:hypothetical protein [Sphingomonas elodea]|uniref:hypothetical protein n=1 Tax=Sphingomonas elodea TaxID=179878 RepID=UPI0002630561|nr:hypothetical protein [Sphingomonas elodea]
MTAATSPFGIVPPPAGSQWGAILRAAAVLGIGTVSALPAAAQSYAARQIGAWTVAASKDGSGCFISRSFDQPGSTTLLLGMDRDGSNHFSVLNENWSIRPQDRLKLTFRLTQGGYPNHQAIGIVADGKQGFVAAFDPKFPTSFAGSKALHIDRGRTPVARLPLDGSGAAVAELRRCVEAQHGPEKAQASDDGVPRDPFAAHGKRKERRR